MMSRPGSITDGTLPPVGQVARPQREFQRRPGSLFTDVLRSALFNPSHAANTEPRFRGIGHNLLPPPASSAQLSTASVRHPATSTALGAGPSLPLLDAEYETGDPGMRARVEEPRTPVPPPPLPASPASSSLTPPQTLVVYKAPPGADFDYYFDLGAPRLAPGLEVVYVGTTVPVGYNASGPVYGFPPGLPPGVYHNVIASDNYLYTYDPLGGQLTNTYQKSKTFHAGPPPIRYPELV